MDEGGSCVGSSWRNAFARKQSFCFCSRQLVQACCGQKHKLVCESTKAEVTLEARRRRKDRAMIDQQKLQLLAEVAKATEVVEAALDEGG